MKRLKFLFLASFLFLVTSCNNNSHNPYDSIFTFDAGLAGVINGTKSQTKDLYFQQYKGVIPDKNLPTCSRNGYKFRCWSLAENTNLKAEVKVWGPHDNTFFASYEATSVSLQIQYDYNTAKAGGKGTNQLVGFHFEFDHSSPVKNVEVDWGDGNKITYSDSADASHTYISTPSSGFYIISINGAVSDFSFYDSARSALYTECNRYIVGLNATRLNKISNNAFRSTMISNIKLNDDIYEIGDYAFWYCDYLKAVYLPAGLRKFADTSFDERVRFYCYVDENEKPEGWPEYSLKNTVKWDCDDGGYDSGYYYYTELDKSNNGAIIDGTDLTDVSITIPSKIGKYNVFKIGDYAFSNNDRIENVTLPNTLIEIGDYAFYDDESLVSITFPESLEIIKRNSFQDCSSLSFNVSGNICYLGTLNNPYKFLIKAKTKDISSVTIEKDCKKIIGHSFEECTQLASITIPEGVTTIDTTFYNCTSLKNVYLPDSLTSVHDYLFSGCTALETTAYDNGLYVGNGGSNLYMYLVKTVNKDITWLNIQEKCKFIGYDAAANCKQLESITIPKNVISMEHSFWCATKLSKVIFEEGSSLESLDNTFYGCGSLCSIILPSSIKKLHSCFQNTNFSLDLRNFDIPIPIEGELYNGRNISFIITVKKESIGLYRKSKCWKYYSPQIISRHL